MKKYIISFIVFAIILSSCTGDLDTTPRSSNDITTENVYRDPNNYIGILAKIYGSLALTGQRGGAGLPDIQGIDEGNSGFVRLLFDLQEITTDHAVFTWNDGSIQDLHKMSWKPTSEFVSSFYYRLYYTISISNEFLRETTQEKLRQREIPQSYWENIEHYRNETRFIRAMCYWQLCDAFANAPFVDESSPVGTSFFPKQYTRAQLFNYVETEMLDAANSLPLPRTNEYGRVDQAAAWSLLAKLYLNAQVYVGEDRFSDCITYCNKIISSGYALENVYQDLFLADNHNSTEIIFPIQFNGLKTQSYGGLSFIVNSSIGDGMIPADYGVNGGWNSLRTTSKLPTKFTNPDDKRALFFSTGRSLIVTQIDKTTDGYAVIKYKNKTATGQNGSNGEFVDIDFPMFRLGDIYLIYAEAFLRGAVGATENEALEYVNDLRIRAYGDNSGNISIADFNLDFIIDERSRELYWECTRRTDLVRFGLFTTDDYLWDWKGGALAGQAVDNKYNIYPIPASDLVSNPTIKQNEGY